MLMKRTVQSLDDGATMKLVLDTHSPDGRRVDVRPVLEIVDNILLRATRCINAVLTDEVAPSEDLGNCIASASVEFKELSEIIKEVSMEVVCRPCHGGDAHATAMGILKTLSKHAWDAKVVLSVAAFAVNYGEFGLFTDQLFFAKMPLAKCIALLKQLPAQISDPTYAFKAQFDETIKLTQAAVELAKCIANLSDKNWSRLEIHRPAYWIIHSVVACTTQIASLLGFRTEPSPTYSISSSVVLQFLHTRLCEYKQHIDEEIVKESYQIIVNTFRFDDQTSHINKLIPLLNLENNAVVECSGAGNQVEIGTFSKKMALLLISSLEISMEEITALGNLYRDGKEYEMIWIPVVEKSTADWGKQKFDELRAAMPWYTVRDPTLIRTEVIMYMKEEWHFSEKTIVVAMDPRGRVQSLDALDMLWIWGNSAFPFTIEQEMSLWVGIGSTLDFIFGGIDKEAVELIKENNMMVCFYGGGDMEWMTRFVELVNRFVGDKRVTYVGKGKTGDQLKQTIEKIEADNLSSCWSYSSIWLFWTRLNSILSSIARMHHLATKELLGDVITLLSFDNKEKGWALFFKGPYVARARADILVILESPEIGDEVEKVGLVSAINDRYKDDDAKHCNRISLNGEIHGKVMCHCGRPMQKSVTYCCCVDDE